MIVTETDRLLLSWLLCLFLAGTVASLAQQKQQAKPAAKSEKQQAKPAAKSAFPPEWLGPGPPAGSPRWVPMEPQKPEAWEKHLESPRVMSHRLLTVQRYQEALRGKLERQERETNRQLNALGSKVDELTNLLEEKQLVAGAKKPPGKQVKK